MSAEQYFGLIAVDPLRPVSVDGINDDSELWKSLSDTTKYALDAEFLYLQVTGTLNRLELAFDTVPNAGAIVDGFERPIDYRFIMDGSTFQAFANGGTDYFSRAFGYEETLNRPYVESTEGVFYPFSVVTHYSGYTPIRFDRPTDCTGTDVDQYCRFDSALAFEVPMTRGELWESSENVLEVKIPWLMLGIGSPSSKKYFDVTDPRNIEFFPFEDISLEVAINEQILSPMSISWNRWTRPNYCERFKPGAKYVSRVFKNIKDDPSVTHNGYDFQGSFPALSDAQYCSAEPITSCSNFTLENVTLSDDNWVTTIWSSPVSAQEIRLHVENSNIDIGYVRDHPEYSVGPSFTQQGPNIVGFELLVTLTKFNSMCSCPRIKVSFLALNIPPLY